MSNQAQRETKRTEQYIQNLSWDELFKLLAFVKMETDGSQVYRSQTPLMTLKLTDNDPVIYLAQAPIGTAESAAGWQARKIETSGPNTVITWADGDAEFDNVATDLTSLTYS